MPNVYPLNTTKGIPLFKEKKNMKNKGEMKNVI